MKLSTPPNRSNVRTFCVSVPAGFDGLGIVCLTNSSELSGPRSESASGCGVT
jgi:hypothetical protein